MTRTRSDPYRQPEQVAAAIHAPAAALVNDITAPRIAVPCASGLAAGSLTGLATLTLAFGLLLAAANAGLVLIVGAADDADPWSHSPYSAPTPANVPVSSDGSTHPDFAGIVGGLTTGTLIAAELIKVLNGVFDPPPQRPALWWTFAGTVLLVVPAPAALATAGSARWTARLDASRLRDL